MEYIVTVYVETPYGAFMPERKTIWANSFDSLIEILRMKGYRRYFIGSLLDKVAITN